MNNNNIPAAFDSQFPLGDYTDQQPQQPQSQQQLLPPGFFSSSAQREWRKGARK